MSERARGPVIAFHRTRIRKVEIANEVYPQRKFQLCHEFRVREFSIRAEAAGHSTKFKTSKLVVSILLALVMAPGLVASFSLTFQGLVQTLNTGGSISLSSPAGIVVDTAGDTFVVDTGNNRVVEVTAQGTAGVLTITGLSPSLSSPSGAAMDAAGNLYVADTGNSRVVEITPTGAGSVISTGSVTLSSPRGVAVDQSGDIFIADTGNNRIVEVTSGGSAAALTITVSSGSSTFSSPKGLGVNISGTLYVADSGNNRIVTVASGSTTGVVQSILGGVTLSNPSGVLVDRIGNVIIADTGNDRIAEIDTSSNGTVLYTGSVTLRGPLAMAADVFGTVYIADTGDSRGVVVDPPVNGDLVPGDQTYSLNKSAVGFGHVQLGSANAVTLTLPFTSGGVGLGGVKVFAYGTQNLDFTAGPDTTCNSSTTASESCSVEISFLPTGPGLRTGAVVLYDGSQNPILTIPLCGWADAPVAALGPGTGAVISTGALATSNPYQLALDGSGNMYVGDYTGKNVTKIPAGGGSATVVAFGTPGNTALQNITGVAVDGAGNLFIGDHQNSRILVMTPGGVVSVLSISGLSPALGFPTAMAFDAAGNLYVADFTNGRIVEISTVVVAGSTSSGVGTVIPTGSFSFTGSTLTGLTIDPQGNIYAAARTQNDSSIIKVTQAGVVSALTIPENITPAISNPQGVAVDANGNLYIVDTANSRIVEITNAGVASVVRISGLSSPATLSTLIFGVTVDPYGNLYICDWTNNRIVFVNVSGAALSFATTNVGQTSSDSPKTATVTNLGNEPLIFSTDPTYTSSFTSNSADTNLCTSTTTLTAGTGCDVSLNFTPQTAGSLSAGITVANNTLNVPSSTQQISASGTGISAGDTTAVAVATNPTSATVGQAITLMATVTDTSTGHTATVPTGTVMFTDTVGSTTVTLNSGLPSSLVAGVATLSGVTLNGVGAHTITANYNGVSGSFLASSGTGSIQIGAGKAATSVALAASANPVLRQTSVTFTAAVTSSASGTPSGSVGFYDGTTLLGSGTLANGAASFATASLAVGAHSVTAVYAGDGNFATATSAVVTETVQDFTLNLSSTSTATATAAPGGVANYALTIAPSGSTFPSAVALSVTGLPTGATAKFTPASLAAGAGSTNVMLAVQLPAVSASLLQKTIFAVGLVPMVGMLFLPFSGSLRRTVRQRGRMVMGLLIFVLMGASVVGFGLAGCGSHSGHVPASQNFTLTVTATAGTLTHSTTLTLTVQ